MNSDWKYFVKVNIYTPEQDMAAQLRRSRIMREWCIDNIGEEYEEWLWTSTGYKFLTEEDATFFKLRFPEYE